MSQAQTPLILKDEDPNFPKILSLDFLEKSYKKYNKKQYVHPDPLEFLYKYEDPEDREIVAVLASSLAYGRVRQILISVEKVLDRIEKPRKFVQDSTPAQINKAISDFRHRFSTAKEVATLLCNIKTIIKKHKTLGAFFIEEQKKSQSPLFALTALSHALTGKNRDYTSLIPDPLKGSACKRMNLMLRWLVRKDNVDPGGWGKADKSMLIIPLDTHMHQFALKTKLTKSKNANMKTAMEITQGFAKFNPKDPIRYDFALTRPGITASFFGSKKEKK